MRNKANALSYAIWSDAGENEVCLKLAKRDILALYSQVEYLRYPTRWIDAPSDFNTRQYTEDLEVRLLSAMACNCDCSQIEDCVLGSDKIKELIQSIGNGSGGGMTEPYWQNNGGQSLPNQAIVTGTAGSCEPNLFACIRQTIDYLHERNLDFFDLVETRTNVVEFASAVSQFTGIDEVTALDTATALFDFYQSAIVESYNAVWTVELRDEIACDIFCQYRNSCGFTINNLLDYFIGKLSNPITREELLQFLDAFLQGSYVQQYTVYAVMAFNLGLLVLSDVLVSKLNLGSFVRGDLERVMRYIKSFANDTDSDYLVLCDCVSQLSYTFIQGTDEGSTPSLLKVRSTPAYSQVCGDNQGYISVMLSRPAIVTSIYQDPASLPASAYPNRWALFLTLEDGVTVRAFGWTFEPLQDAVGLTVTAVNIAGECATGYNYYAELGLA